MAGGFRLSGVAAGDRSGRAVSTAGDVNGDGIDDLLIGARRADPNGERSGASYVVFGGAGVGSSGNLDLSALDGTNGFSLSGVASDDRSGFAVSTAGDVNGDGLDDLLIGAPGVILNSSFPGASYVVFGQGAPPVTCNGLPATIIGTFGHDTFFGTRATMSSMDGSGTTSSGVSGPETSSAAARVTIGYSATKARTNCSARTGTMS